MSFLFDSLRYELRLQVAQPPKGWDYECTLPLQAQEVSNMSVGLKI